VLIYNNRKEFVSVTDDTLSDLGYYNARQLHEDAIDFADLFENKPGYVHNFKNFSWIDFLLHSEQDNIKARIRCNGKIFECGFKISTYPMDSDEDGYSIELADLVTVGEDENSQVRSEFDDPMESPQETQTVPTIQSEPPVEPKQPEVLSSEPVTMPEFNDEPLAMPEFDDEPVAMPEFNDEPLEFDTTTQIEPEIDNAPVDFGMDTDTSSPAPIQETPSVTPDTSAQTTNGIDAALIQRLNLETPQDYSYDPSIAADELGLPADLIDEFVGDFIVQAKKFRPDLEEALEKQDYDNIQILSHKLKGVAANLRIEDALEVLTFINTSQDDVKLKDHLTYLFYIVHKLEHGEDAAAFDTAVQTDTPTAMEPIAETTQDETALESESFDLDIPPMDDTNVEMDNSDTQDDTIEMPDFSMDTEPTEENPTQESESFDLDITSTPENDSLEDDIIPMDLEPMDIGTAENDSDFDDLNLTTSETAANSADDFAFDLIDNDSESLNSYEEPLQTADIEMPDLSNESFDLPSDEAVQTSAPVEPVDTKKFDIQATADSLDMSLETVKSYINDFVDQANMLKGELESALTSQNLDQVKELATQLKGMSEALHMKYASELLSTHQTTADPQEAIASAKELFIFVREL
jgi:HPt (histidine-containing phosphotransfer) domain-containing protein